MDRATRISEKLARLWVKLGVLGGHLWRRPGDGLIAEPPEAGASTDATQAYRDAVHRAFEWISDTIRIAMLALVGFAFFCVVTTLGASDISLFELEPRIKAPLVDVTMSFPWFLVVAPIVLVGIVI
jgi:hypothetical protein